LIEVIQGESELLNYTVYPREEIEKDVLISIPIENLEMIINTLKGVKEHKRNEKSSMLPK
jgi:hypothetical protein